MKRILLVVLMSAGVSLQAMYEGGSKINPPTFKKKLNPAEKKRFKEAQEKLFNSPVNARKAHFKKLAEEVKDLIGKKEFFKSRDEDGWNVRHHFASRGATPKHESVKYLKKQGVPGKGIDSPNGKSPSVKKLRKLFETGGFKKGAVKELFPKDKEGEKSDNGGGNSNLFDSNKFDDEEEGEVAPLKFDISDSSGEYSGSHIDEESYEFVSDDEDYKEFLTYDKIKDLIPNGFNRDAVTYVMEYLTEGKEDKLEVLQNIIENGPNVFKIQLSNGLSLPNWLLLVMENNDVPQDRAVKVASIVGPYVVVNGRYPFLDKIIYAVIEDNASEELYKGFIGKATIKDPWLLAELENNKDNKEKCKRILEHFGSKEDPVEDPVEDPLRLDPPVDDGVKPTPISLIGKLFYSSCVITIAYIAWPYLGYSSSEKKNKGLTVG